MEKRRTTSTWSDSTNPLWGVPTLLFITFAVSMGSPGSMVKGLDAVLRSPAKGSQPPYVLPKSQDALQSTHGSYHIWSPKHQYFACLVPKAGCTSWLKYIRTMQLPEDQMPGKEQQYKPTSHEKYSLHFRQFKHGGDKSSLLAALNDPSYFRFVVARHPWDRLLSAYRSKYEGWCKGDPVCFYKNFTIGTDGGKTELSFHNFVRLLTRIPAGQLNAHFRPVSLLCELSRIRYDFLGDLTNLTSNDYISERVGFPVTFSNFSIAQNTLEGYSESKYYEGRTHKVQPCRDETVRYAEEVYAADAALLGYSFDNARVACRKYGQSEVPLQA